MKDYGIVYDERLGELASSLSRISETPAYRAGTNPGMEKYILLWSFREGLRKEKKELQDVMGELSSTGYIEALLLLPAPYQRGGDLMSFMRTMSSIEEVGRVIFFDLTPISKLGATAKPSVNLSAFPLLIKYMKEMGVGAKVITFNEDLTTQAKVIEGAIGKGDRAVLIVDNYVDDPDKYIPVVSTYAEKGYAVYVFSTFFAKYPGRLGSISTVITTNAIKWDNTIAIDLAPVISEFVDAVR